MPISVPIRQVKTIIRLYVTHYTVIKECHDRLMMDYFETEPAWLQIRRQWTPADGVPFVIA